MANRPVHEIKMGRIRAAIWANETEQGCRLNVRVGRLFKDGAQWKTSESFGRDDLPLVCKVLDRAHDWLYENGQRTEETETEVDGSSVENL